MFERIILVCALLLPASGAIHAARIESPLDLFTEISYSGADNAPPPIDSLSVYQSAIDVVGLAAMPEQVTISVPRPNGSVVATVTIEHMDRREGFGERDPQACIHGDPRGCEIIPIPGFPADLFSYTWIGQGDGYDLRLTIHHGNAVGVFSGTAGRFGISFSDVKELRVEYFRTDDSVGDAPDGGRQDSTSQPAKDEAEGTLRSSDAQNAIVARIEPDAPASTPQLDMLVLFTEEARRQAGGNPTDCHDTNGVQAYIYQGINDINTAFQRSQVPARVGVVTVTKLNGYTLIPYAGDEATIRQNRQNIKNSSNIRTFRNAVGSDVVTVLFDTQKNLGVCGVAYVQRHGCTYPTATPGCDIGAQFSDWTYYLDTVQCSAVTDAFTHELGHVLGAEHQFNGGIPRNVASYPYSYGYNVSGHFETIMSQLLTPQYPRILQFSNPNVLYGGFATGNAATADNALTIANLSPGVAGFRTRPERVFADGFDVNNPCPGINY